MTTYLIHASYSPEGMRGLLKEGGTARRDAAAGAIKSVGGRLESMHFAFGDTDAYIIAELPTPEAAAALGLAVGASGSVRSAATVLLTPEQIDEARKLKPEFRPAGG